MLFTFMWLFAPAMNNQIFLFLFSFLTAPTKASRLLMFSSDSRMLYFYRGFLRCTVLNLGSLAELSS
jgi:hypothetical protein